MNSIPTKTYFAKELALRILLGDKAYADFKRFMDPCCGPILNKVPPSYASDAEAIAAGLEPGTLYTTLVSGRTTLNIVPNAE